MAECRKLFLAASSSMSILLLAGPIFGWAALSDILKGELFYAELCHGEAPCYAQEAALDAAFALACAASGVILLPGGLLLDKAGPLVTTAVGGAVVVAGVLGMGSLTWTDGHLHVDLLPVFLVGVAVGGSVIGLCGFSIGFLFPSHSALLIALASVLFDGSCLVYPVLRVAYDAGVEYRSLFAGYGVLGVVVFVLLSAGWYLNKEDMDAIREAARARQGLACSDGREGALECRPISRQVDSLEFVSILCFCIVQLTHCNLYLGSVANVNGEIAMNQGIGDARLSTVNTIISFVIPMGFLAIPAITASARRFSSVGTLQVTSVLGIVVNILQLVPSLRLQVLAAIFFVAFRAFLYSTVPQFNARYFGVLNMGRIQGFCFLAGGVANLVHGPIVNYCLVDLEGRFAALLLISIAMSVIPMVPCTWLQHREWRREALAASLMASTPDLSCEAESFPMLDVKPR